MKILVVGLGLIGGSIAKALKGKHKVYGLDVDEAVMQQCYQEGLIHNQDHHTSFVEMEMLILCLYPEAIVDFIRDHQEYLAPGCLLMDVCGLKEQLMASVQSFLRHDLHFIGGHPMAGREGRGLSQAEATLFEKANFLLINDPTLPKKAELIAEQVIEDLGCQAVVYLTAKEHDALIAHTSHMPHILAALLIKNNDHPKRHQCAAGSYHDLTRVADLNAQLWTELFLQNRLTLLDEIHLYQAQLKAFEDLLQGENADEMVNFLDEAGAMKRQVMAQVKKII